MKKKIDNNKLFVIKKYVWATSAQQALKKEKKVTPDDCWIDENWWKANQYPKDAIGFMVEN